MLFKKLIVAAVLAFRASAAAVASSPFDESRHALDSRASPPPPDIPGFTDNGIVNGTVHDTLWTHGLSTCPGVVASGKNARAGGVTKVLGHIRPKEHKAQLDEWVKQVRSSGMTDISVLLYLMDPAKVPQAIGGPATQKSVNDYAKASAMKIQEGFVTKLREQLEVPSPADRLRVDAHGYIYVGNGRVL